MSSEVIKKPVPPDSALVKEIDGLVEEIKSFQQSHGRSIAKKIKRTRKGRTLGPELEALGILDAPESLLALYWNWNGAATGSRWDRALFFGHEWLSADIVIKALKISRLEQHVHCENSLRFCVGGEIEDLSTWCAPSSENDDSPLVASVPWSQRIYFAFDGILPMLRSVVAAEKAGVFCELPADTRT